jgi:arsenate reductase
MKVVFLCVENSNRSQMAEAFARMHGGIDAYSAGSRPSGRVNPRAVAAMEELGYDLAAHESKSLAELPDVEFDAAVTMGCGDACPTLLAKRRIDWQIPDPKELPPAEFAQVRDMIGRQVRDLLAELGASMSQSLNRRWASAICCCGSSARQWCSRSCAAFRLHRRKGPQCNSCRWPIRSHTACWQERILPPCWCMPGGWSCATRRCWCSPGIGCW